MFWPCGFFSIPWISFLSLASLWIFNPHLTRSSFLSFSLSLSRWVRLLSALISPQPVPNNPALNTRSPRPFCPGPDLQHPATIGFLSLPFQDLTPLAPSAIPNYLSRAPAPLHLEWVSNVRGRQQVWRQDHKGKKTFLSMVPLKNIQYSGLLDFLLTELWAFSLRKNDICIGIWIEIQMDFECWLHKALLNVSWGKKIKKSYI